MICPRCRSGALSASPIRSSNGCARFGRDRAALHRLETVDAAQESRLPRARRHDQAHHFVLVDVEIYAVEHGVRAESLHNRAHLDERNLSRLAS